MKRKLLAMLLACTMAFSLVACGGSAKNDAEETKQEEAVEETFSEQEEKEEEVVEESSAKEVAEVEEPVDDGAPVQPTSRIAHIDVGSSSADVNETLEYDSNGGYTVKGRFDYTRLGSSLDYEVRYDSKGEVVYMKHAYYNQDVPNGFINEVDFIQGYPLAATNSEPVEIYSGIESAFVASIGSYVSEGDFVESGYTLLDSNGNLCGSKARNSTWEVYNFITNMLNNGGTNFPSPLDRLTQWKNMYPVDECKLSSKVEGNKVFMICSYTEEEYDAEKRENVNKEKYAFVDVITYGENGLIESFNEYFGGDYSLENIDDVQPGTTIKYVYDSQGNVLEYNTPYCVVTYDYGNGFSNQGSSSDEATVAAESSSADITGRWKCRSDKYPYDVVYFDADGTGNLYKGIDAYPLTYTFDGKVASVTANGQELKFYVDLNEGTMVEGESDAPYDKE